MSVNAAMSYADQILSGRFWEITKWNELRVRVSFLTLMNKRAGHDRDVRRI